MQYSIHPPSRFMRAYASLLLPDWSQPIGSVLIVLQAACCPLTQFTAETEVEKDALRDRALQWSLPLIHSLQAQGHLADLFDPRTGWPLHSQAGPLRLDDVAVVQSCLGYHTEPQGDCSVLIHPTWQSAVYPSILVSSAGPELLAQLIEAWLGQESSPGPDRTRPPF